MTLRTNARRSFELTRSGLISNLLWGGTQEQLVDPSLTARSALVDHLLRTIQADFRRGVSRHWAYCQARHIGLTRLWRLERYELQILEDVQ